MLMLRGAGEQQHCCWMEDGMPVQRGMHLQCTRVAVSNVCKSPHKEDEEDNDVIVELGGITAAAQTPKFSHVQQDLGGGSL